MKLHQAILIASILPLSTGALVACAVGVSPSTPSTLASQTTADEKLALGVETGYQAAALAARTYAQFAKPAPVELAKLRTLNQGAFRYTCRTRIAYNYVHGRDLGTDLAGACSSVLLPGDLAGAKDVALEAGAALSLIQEFTALTRKGTQ